MKMGVTYRKTATGCDLEKLWISASEGKNTTRTIQYPVTSLREKEPDKIAGVDKDLYMHASMQRRLMVVEITTIKLPADTSTRLYTASRHVS